MKLVSRFLIKVVSIIEGKNIRYGLQSSIGWCNVYQGNYRPRKTTGGVISSMPYKKERFAKEARTCNTTSDYIGTYEVFIKIN